MHVPDGFLDAPTSVATGAVAVVAVGVALRGARRELDDRTAPVAGLVAAFVFAAQMINFPVGAGTSGHLLGAALAVALAGPFTATLCLAVVLGVQAVFLADGGLTALGTNIVLMGVAGVWAAWAVLALGRALLPTRVGVVAPLAALAAFVSVPVAAAVFTGLFAVGGTTTIDVGSVLAAMVGVHLVIGLGEALITGLVVASVVAVRPDLVHAARPAMRARRADLAAAAATDRTVPTGVRS
ncbi:energy-coupling factor ABC transporter permease [Nocardioidaceae bacterium]|nr:energy-coupling factor ABC transporter permease [Nocardioidaceae bacterium]